MRAVVVRRGIAPSLRQPDLGGGELRSLASIPTVFVIDPDPTVRRCLDSLICGEGWHTRMLGSAEEFVIQRCALCPTCLVSEVDLPGLSGLGLQERLAGRADIPLIFLASHADVATVVRAMRAGAVEFLIKPFRNETVISAMRSALELSRMAIPRQTELRAISDRYATLSRREREVMGLVIEGLLNKQIAGRLGISEITVKAHRGRVMRKMGVGVLAQLVGIAARLSALSSSRDIAPSVCEVPGTLHVRAPVFQRAWSETVRV